MRENLLADKRGAPWPNFSLRNKGKLSTGERGVAVSKFGMRIVM